MAGRRSNGEGTIDRVHDHPSCPPNKDGKRPNHRCQGRWRARVTVTVNGVSKRKTVYGKTQDECRARMDDVKAANKLGQAVAGRTLTVAEWMDQWMVLQAPHWKPLTLAGTASRVHRWINPYLGQLRLDRLTPQHVDGLYQTMRQAGMTEGTVLNTHGTLRKAMTAAVNYSKAPSNPTDRVLHKPAHGGGGRSGMTLDEAMRVVRAAGDNPRFLIALLCGLRQGEALALRWCDVHLDAPEPFLQVNGSNCRITGQGVLRVTCKSKASQGRIVPLGDLPVVVAALRAQRARHLALGWTDPEQHVHTTSKGTAIAHTGDSHNWRQLLRQAGVGPYTLHQARNTCAALLEDSGNLPRVVADILGHAKVETTYLYQRGNEAAKSTAMGRLGAHLTAAGERKLTAVAS